MTDKKRKGAAAAVEQPLKKSKKNAPIVSDSKAAVQSEDAVTTVVPTANISKKQSRKKAADFLDDEDAGTQKAPAVKSKTSERNGKKGGAPASNGVKQVKNKQGHEAPNSLIAEAEHTQDQELEEEYGSDDNDIDTAPALLAGFDSDTEDQAQDTADVSTDRTAPIPQYKKTSKKLRKAKESSGQNKPGAVYVGRIPHGFYEPQMRAYFSQFGDISRLRLSRNRRTGASKHFAFIEFTSEEVAKIVAETMDNYLMFGHILKCKFAPEGSLHEDVWKGANKKYRQIPRHKLIREKEEKPKTLEQWEKKSRKEETNRKRKAEKLKELGYEFENPKLKKPQPSLAADEVGNEKENGGLAVTGAIEPPKTVPKDELATKKMEEKNVKTKKSKSKTSDADAEAKRDTLVDEISRAEVDAAMKKHKKEEQQAAKASKQGRDTETGKAAPAAADGKKLKGILKKPKK